MSSGTFIVQKALQKIGAHSQIRKANPSSIEDGFESLGWMLQLWLSQGIALGIKPISAPGDEVDEPEDATQVIIDNLALILAPDREGGKDVVSPTLRVNANRGFHTLKALYQVFTIPDKVLSSTAPSGAGNTNRFFNQRIFVGRGFSIPSSNS